MADLPEVKIDLREFFLCPRHGMLQPGRFDADWTDEYSCPVPDCDEEMQPIDFSPLLSRLSSPQPRFTQAEIEAALTSKEAVEAAARSWWKGFDKMNAEWQQAALSDHRLALTAALAAAFSSPPHEHQRVVEEICDGLLGPPSTGGGS